MAFKQIVIPKAKTMDDFKHCELCGSDCHETDDHIAAVTNDLEDLADDNGSSGGGGWEDTPFSPPE